jgi:Ser/Thr protein kinase RdoA (MazF antagonist)
LQGEIEVARSEVAAIDALAPALATALASRLDSVGERIGDAPLPPAFGHGELKPGQFLFDGPLSGLVDFDTTCVAEAALDLAQFTAQLAVTTRKASLRAGPRTDTGYAPGLAFLHEYARVTDFPGDAQVLWNRVAAYQAIALVRIAVNSWRHLKPARVQAAEELLSELATGESPLVPR